MVRPNFGAAEGCVGGGSGGPPPGKFCKKDTKSCALGTSGTLHTHSWRSVHAVESSTVSPTADA